jgi:hypothetical protein
MLSAEILPHRLPVKKSGENIKGAALAEGFDILLLFDNAELV